MIYLNTHKLLNDFKSTNNIKLKGYDITLYQSIMISVDYIMTSNLNTTLKLAGVLYNLYRLSSYKHNGISKKDFNRYLSDAYNDFDYVYDLMKLVYDMEIADELTNTNPDAMKVESYIMLSKDSYNEEEAAFRVKEAEDLLLVW